MTEAFTYCWTDHETNMFYIGYHKGNQDDGYVCSSKWVLEEYKKRPEDFTRMILAEGTVEDCRALEVSILKTTDAMHSDRFYNQSNGQESFACKHHSKETKRKIGNASKGNKYAVGHKTSEDTLRKMSNANKGQIPWNTGKHWSEEMRKHFSKKSKNLSQETRKKMSQARKGKQPWNKGTTGLQRHSLETRMKMSESHTNRGFVQ